MQNTLGTSRKILDRNKIIQVAVTNDVSTGILYRCYVCLKKGKKKEKICESKCTTYDDDDDESKTTKDHATLQYR